MTFLIYDKVTRDRKNSPIPVQSPILIRQCQESQPVLVDRLSTVMSDSTLCDRRRDFWSKTQHKETHVFTNN